MTNHKLGGYSIECRLLEPDEFARAGTELTIKSLQKHEYNDKWIELLHSAESNSRKKTGKTFAFYLTFVVSLVGNSFIGIIVYKRQTMRKPINYFIVNMAMSDLLFPMFLFPSNLADLYVDSWLISGPLGQALCKLFPFLWYVSCLVSIQSLVLIAVDRFGAVVFPLRFPVITSKLCPFFILATWIVAMAVMLPYLFAFNLIEYPGELSCVLRWKEAFGESSSPGNVCAVFYFIPIALLVILYSVIIIKFKTQKIPGEQSANAEQQRDKKNRNMLKMAIAFQANNRTTLRGNAPKETEKW